MVNIDKVLHSNPKRVSELTANIINDVINELRKSSFYDKLGLGDSQYWELNRAISKSIKDRIIEHQTNLEISKQIIRHTDSKKGADCVAHLEKERIVYALATSIYESNLALTERWEDYNSLYYKHSVLIIKEAT